MYTITRFKTNLHPPTANLTKFQKGVYYLAIKIFNNLPHNIKDLANEIVLLQNALKRFLRINPFIIVKNSLIIGDIPLKIELTVGFKCFIIVLIYS
jgi:hypothetical protein